MKLFTVYLTGLSIASTFICGCGPVRYPNYYELSAPVPIARGNTALPLIQSVAVRQFDAPPFLRSGPIAYRESAEKLGFYPYDRWAVDPRRSATVAMINDLQATGAFQSVGPFDGRTAPECIMTGTIEHLEEVDRGKSVSIDVRVSARLMNAETGEILWHGTASKDAAVEPRSVSGVVSQLSLGLGSAVQELASSIQDHLRSSPPHIAQPMPMQPTASNLP
jgi:ABC-type uncharacterized transport system auxiliary subunit